MTQAGDTENGNKSDIRATLLDIGARPALGKLDYFTLTRNLGGRTIIDDRKQTQRWSNVPGHPGKKEAEQGFEASPPEPRAGF